jgi:membrane protein DedA with SNARE-associated domain
MRYLVPPLVVLVIGGYIGQAFFPRLVDSNPTLLILLNPRNVNLALVSNDLDAWTFYGVASFRLLLTDPIWFFIGREYGNQAIVWLEKRSPTYGGMARHVEGWFGKAAYPLVALAPNNWICLLAGAAWMRPVVFITLNLAGTFGRLFLIRHLGVVFSDPLSNIRGFISDYQAPLLVLSISLVALSIWNERRQGRGELESLAHLDDELIDPQGDEDD